LTGSAALPLRRTFHRSGQFQVFSSPPLLQIKEFIFIQINLSRFPLGRRAELNPLYPCSENARGALDSPSLTSPRARGEVAARSAAGEGAPPRF
jgi:hypothetical protein